MAGLGGGFAVASLLSLVLLLLDAGVSMADVQIEIGYWLALGLALSADSRARALTLAGAPPRRKGMASRLRDPRSASGCDATRRPGRSAPERSP